MRILYMPYKKIIVDDDVAFGSLARAHHIQVLCFVGIETHTVRYAVMPIFSTFFQIELLFARQQFFIHLLL